MPPFQSVHALGLSRKPFQSSMPVSLTTCLTAAFSVAVPPLATHAWNSWSGVFLTGVGCGLLSPSSLAGVGAALGAGVGLAVLPSSPPALATADPTTPSATTLANAMANPWNFLLLTSCPFPADGRWCGTAA